MLPDYPVLPDQNPFHRVACDMPSTIFPPHLRNSGLRGRPNSARPKRSLRCAMPGHTQEQALTCRNSHNITMIAPFVQTTPHSTGSKGAMGGVNLSKRSSLSGWPRHRLDQETMAPHPPTMPKHIFFWLHHLQDQVQCQITSNRALSTSTWNAFSATEVPFQCSVLLKATLTQEELLEEINGCNTLPADVRLQTPTQDALMEETNGCSTLPVDFRLHSKPLHAEWGIDRALQRCSWILGNAKRNTTAIYARYLHTWLDFKEAIAEVV